MVAKKRSRLRFLQEALREHQVDKTYWALVKGIWPTHLKQVDKPLEKYLLASGERRVRVSRAGKSAVTDFQVLRTFRQEPSCTLMEARPLTGRTHQIRVHALSAACPLAGDDKYTDDTFNQQMKQKGVKRLFLHAAELTFPIPDQEEKLTIHSPLPDDLQQVLDKLAE
jgi:23S rRNA pseudouridine955/2504/2580 synthase